MNQSNGKCPGCDGEGLIGEACPEKGCLKRGYHYIPPKYWDAAHEDDATPDPVIGQLVGDYLVVSRIGAGGFGKVYVALQRPLYRLKGALKLIEFPSENVMLMQALLEKFQGEAEALADLTHPNIVRLLKYGTHGKKPYLVMEYVDHALTLRQEIQRRARSKKGFSHSELQTIFQQVLNGLAAAHAQNIIHRDVKPENVMLQSVVGNPLHVRILDFGTAKFIENRADTKWPLGSPSYMAPEQVHLKGIGPWSDLYAVGVMIFELLTGHRPFPGSTENEIVANKMDESFDPIASFENFDFPDVIVAFMRKALARETHDRFQTAAEFGAEMFKAFEALSEHPGAFGIGGAELTGLVDSSDFVDVSAEVLDQTRRQPVSEPPRAAYRTEMSGELVAVTGTKSKPVKSTLSNQLRWVAAVLFTAVVFGGVFAFFTQQEEPAEPVVHDEPDMVADVEPVVVQDLGTDAANPTDAAADVAVELADLIELEEERMLTKVVAGKFHTCALSEGRVRCWGANHDGELGLGNETMIGDDEPAYKAPFLDLGLGVEDIAIAGDRGASFSCALLQGGVVRCWGANDSGQLGLGHKRDIGDDESPTSVPPVSLGGRAVAIATGASQFASHVCALLDDGRVRCWGGNNYGQLGLSNKTTVGDDETPSSVAFVEIGGDAAKIAVGKYHSCALLEKGYLRCWGWNSRGQLGLGHTRDIGDDESPKAAKTVKTGFKSIAEITLGRRHTCARSAEGDVRCWGWNSQGQLGLGHTDDIGDDEKPSKSKTVRLGAKAIQVSAGENHTCALLEDGAVRCWGDNKFGQLGQSHTRDVGDDETPDTVPAVYLGKPAVAIVAGSYHNCAVLEDDTLRCWGYNKFGQLGYGHTDTIGDTETPQGAGEVPVFAPEKGTR